MKKYHQRKIAIISEKFIIIDLYKYIFFKIDLGFLNILK